VLRRLQPGVQNGASVVALFPRSAANGRCFDSGPWRAGGAAGRATGRGDWCAVDDEIRKTAQQAVFRHLVFRSVPLVRRGTLANRSGVARAESRLPYLPGRDHVFLPTPFLRGRARFRAHGFQWLTNYMRKRLDRFQSLPHTIASRQHTMASLSGHHCIACMASTRFRSDGDVGQYSTSPNNQREMH
jgi:hypothetical protein